MVHFSIPSTILVQKVQNETVLLNTENGEYYKLNSMGSKMLSALESQGCPDAIIDSLHAQYHVDKEELRKDLMELIHLLEGFSVLERTQTGPAC